MRPLFVEEIAIHPDYQGRGIGSFVIEQLEHLAARARLHPPRPRRSPPTTSARSSSTARAQLLPDRRRHLPGQEGRQRARAAAAPHLRNNGVERPPVPTRPARGRGRGRRTPRTCPKRPAPDGPGPRGHARRASRARVPSRPPRTPSERPAPAARASKKARTGHSETLRPSAIFGSKRVARTASARQLPSASAVAGTARTTLPSGPTA